MWNRAHVASVRWAVSLSVTAGIAYFIARRLNVDLGGLWVVLQAVLILRRNIVDSVMVARDQVIGTTTGVAFGAICGLLPLHSIGIALAVFLTATVCSAITMLRGVVNIACVAAAIVILLPVGKPSYVTAWDRFSDTLLGAAIALAIAGLGSLTSRKRLN